MTDFYDNFMTLFSILLNDLGIIENLHFSELFASIN